MSLKFESLAKGKRRFKLVISMSIYIHNEVDPHYHRISNMSQRVYRDLQKKKKKLMIIREVFFLARGVN